MEGKESVNANIPKELCSVRYPDFSDAVRLCSKFGKQCKLGKSDMTSAFRHLGILKKHWKFLVMKARNPDVNDVNYNKWFYFVDKCLTFGSSISCAHFQAFSDTVAHIVQHKTGEDLVNYLDDYLFAALMSLLCNNQIKIFMEVCELIKFPVSLEKTFWASSQLVFLGLLLNALEQTVSIPADKVQKGLTLVNKLIERKSRKLTLAELQKLCGFLNFLCRCVVPGRAFMRRFYALTQGNTKLKDHHHIRMRRETREDLLMWREFLKHPSVYCRPFMDFNHCLTADVLDFYTDAAKSFGLGGYYNTHWMHGKWNRKFILEKDPSITFLELFAVVVGVLNWSENFRNQRVIVFCDNIGAVQIINSSSSKCRYCMKLVRILTLHSMVQNIRVFARHVEGVLNEKSDWLSRGKIQQFKEKYGCEHTETPSPLPEVIWPVEKLWEES